MPKRQKVEKLVPPDFEKMAKKSAKMGEFFSPDFMFFKNPKKPVTPFLSKKGQNVYPLFEQKVAFFDVFDLFFDPFLDPNLTTTCQNTHVIMYGFAKTR